MAGGLAVIGGASDQFQYKNGTTFFVQIAGCNQSPQTVEAQAELLCRAAATFKNLVANVQSNSNTISTPFTFRKNGADTSLTVSAGASTTGIFADNSDTVSFSSGDRFCLKIIGGTSGDGGAGANVNVALLGTSTTTSYHTAFSGGVSNFAAGETDYYSFAGGTYIPFTTIAWYQQQITEPGTAHHLRMYVSANSQNASVTVSFTIGGTAGNQTFSVGAAATGAFEDTTHTDALVANNLMALSVVTTGTGTITWTTNSIAIDNTDTSKCGAYGALNASTDTSNRYASPWGPFALLTSESIAKSCINQLGTWSLLSSYILTNSTGTTTTINSRVNGAAGNQSISVGSGVTGWLSDNTNNDSLGMNDLIDIQVPNTAGLNFLEFASLFVITITTPVIINFSGIAELLAARKNDKGSLIEALKIVQRDNAPPFELLRSVKMDRNSSIEALGGVRRDPVPPIEFSGTMAIRASDYGIPLEFLNRIQDENPSPLEFLNRTQDDESPSPLEYLGRIQDDESPIPLELLQRIQDDESPIPLELLGGLSDDNANAILESLARLQGDSAAQLELLSTTTSIGIQTDVSAPLEIFAGVRSDNNNQSEFLSGARQDSSSSAEFLAGLRWDSAARLESLLTALANNDSLIEILAGVRSDNNNQSEFLSGARQDSSSSAEFLRIAFRDHIVQTETLFGIRLDSALPIESLSIQGSHIAAPLEFLSGAIRSNIQTPVEFLNRTFRDHAAQTEFLSSARFDTSSQVEFLSGVRLDSTFQTEFSGSLGVSSDFGVPLEFLVRVRQDAAAAIEFLNGFVKRDSSVPIESLFGVRCDSGIPFEQLIGALRDSSAPLEWTGTAAIQSDSSIPIEALVRVLSDSSVPLEWITRSSVRTDASALLELLASAKRDNSAPIESLVGMRRDSIVPIELSGLLFIQQDTAAQLEFLGKLSSDSSAPLEWLMQNVRANVSSPLELLRVSPTFNSNSLLELLLGQRLNNAALVEYTGRFVGDVVARLETLKSSITANSSFKTEFVISVLVNSVGQVESLILATQGLTADSGIPLEIIVPHERVLIAKVLIKQLKTMIEVKQLNASVRIIATRR